MRYAAALGKPAQESGCREGGSTQCREDAEGALHPCLIPLPAADEIEGSQHKTCYRRDYLDGKSGHGDAAQVRRFAVVIEAGETEQSAAGNLRAPGDEDQPSEGAPVFLSECGPQREYRPAQHGGGAEVMHYLSQRIGEIFRRHDLLQRDLDALFDANGHVCFVHHLDAEGVLAG